MNDVIIYQMNLDNVFVILTFFKCHSCVVSGPHSKAAQCTHITEGNCVSFSVHSMRDQVVFYLQNTQTDK